MNVSERIETLLDNCEGVMIAKPPPSPNPDQPKYYVKADQKIETGKPGNFAIVNHQAIGDGIVECLEQLAKQVEAATTIKLGVKSHSPILTRDGTRGTTPTS